MYGAEQLLDVWAFKSDKFVPNSVVDFINWQLFLLNAYKHIQEELVPYVWVWYIMDIFVSITKQI